MKKTIKIILTILLIMSLNFAVLIKSVQAVENKSITVYSKGEFKRIIKYNGIAVKTTHAVYNENGIEYPAYCLNKELEGVGEYIASYDVTNQGKISDIELRRVVTNGYPYKSIEQLGVINESEAYIATKQAIYCYIYNRGTENYSAVGEAGNRVINAINNILNNAKNSTETFEEPNIKIEQSENWQVENNYISKQYEIKNNNFKFIVSLEDQPNGSKITNLENQEKSEFSSGEKFKVLIPITSLEKSGEFKIKIKTEIETKPVFLGEAPNAYLQNYALTAYSYEDVETDFLQEYPQNETKIIIEKRDAETKEILKCAKFEILNQNKEIIYVAETNSEGKIILEQINPGIYYIREVKPPEGYEINEELKTIEVKMNEEKIVKIKNNKIIIEEPPIEEPIIEEKPEIEEIPVVELPKLPITGM